MEQIDEAEWRVLDRSTAGESGGFEELERGAQASTQQNMGNVGRSCLLLSEAGR